MDPVREFLEETIPRRFAENEGLARRVLGVYRIDVADAGSWTIEMVGAGRVVEGRTSYATPVSIALTRDDFARLVAEPTSAWELFTAGRIETGDVCRAIALLEAFFPGTVRRAVPAPLYRAVFPLLASRAAKEVGP